MKFNRYVRKVKIMLRGAVYSVLFKLCHTKGFKQKDALIILGSTRSGSTWLAELVSSLDGHLQVFEPMNTDYVKSARKAGIVRNMYLEKHADWPEGERFFSRVLSGKVINPWTACQMSLTKIFKAKRLVVKFVRANMLTEWLANNIEMKTPAMVIRHPCAIIASQLQKGWAPSKTVLLSNPYFDQRAELKSRCMSFDKPEERAALAWCVRYHAPLTLDKPVPFILVCYERLVRDGETEIRKLFNAWDLPVTEQVLAQLVKPSDTVTSSSQVVSGKDPLEGWRKTLNQQQIENIMNVLAAFDMDFYSSELEPDYRKLETFFSNDVCR